jgi:hypothetical protein
MTRQWIRTTSSPPAMKDTLYDVLPYREFVGLGEGMTALLA